MPKYILILLITIVIDFSAGILIEDNAEKPRKKKAYLIISVVSTLLVFFVFKYPCLLHYGKGRYYFAENRTIEKTNPYGPVRNFRAKPYCPIGKNAMSLSV